MRNSNEIINDDVREPLLGQRQAEHHLVAMEEGQLSELITQSSQFYEKIPDNYYMEDFLSLANMIHSRTNKIGFNPKDILYLLIAIDSVYIAAIASSAYLNPAYDQAHGNAFLRFMYPVTAFVYNLTLSTFTGCVFQIEILNGTIRALQNMCFSFSKAQAEVNLEFPKRLGYYAKQFAIGSLHTLPTALLTLGAISPFLANADDQPPKIYDDIPLPKSLIDYFNSIDNKLPQIGFANFTLLYLGAVAIWNLIYNNVTNALKEKYSYTKNPIAREINAFNNTLDTLKSRHRTMIENSLSNIYFKCQTGGDLQTKQFFNLISMKDPDNKDTLALLALFGEMANSSSKPAVEFDQGRELKKYIAYITYSGVLSALVTQTGAENHLAAMIALLGVDIGVTLKIFHHDWTTQYRDATNITKDQRILNTLGVWCLHMAQMGMSGYIIHNKQNIPKLLDKIGIGDVGNNNILSYSLGIMIAMPLMYLVAFMAAISKGQTIARMVNDVCDHYQSYKLSFPRWLKTVLTNKNAFLSLMHFPRSFHKHYILLPMMVSSGFLLSYFSFATAQKLNSVQFGNLAYVRLLQTLQISAFFNGFGFVSVVEQFFNFKLRLILLTSDLVKCLIPGCHNIKFDQSNPLSRTAAFFFDYGSSRKHLAVDNFISSYMKALDHIESDTFFFALLQLFLGRQLQDCDAPTREIQIKAIRDQLLIAGAKLTDNAADDVIENVIKSYSDLDRAELETMMKAFFGQSEAKDLLPGYSDATDYWDLFSKLFDKSIRLQQQKSVKSHLQPKITSVAALNYAEPGANRYRFHAHGGNQPATTQNGPLDQAHVEQMLRGGLARR